MSDVMYRCNSDEGANDSHSIANTVASPTRASFGARTSSVSSCWYSLLACVRVGKLTYVFICVSVVCVWLCTFYRPNLPTDW